MRVLLLAFWAVLAGGTLYSAFLHKAPAIETDITERSVTAVSAAGGSADIVNVDGRNVTLNGQVASSDAEASYLGSIDTVNGALGPVDRLSVAQKALKTFVHMDRSADGIRLSGVVASEDDRAALVSTATAMNAGTIDDQLIVGGGSADWMNDAQSGLVQLIGLESGTLYVSDDARSISGNAPSLAAAQSLSGLGDTWSSFATTDGVEDPRITELTAQVADKDGMIGSLKDSLAQETSRIEELTSQVVASDVKVSDLETKLSALDGEKTDLMAKLATATAAAAAATVASAASDDGDAASDDTAAAEDTGTTTAATDASIAELNSEIAKKDKMVEALGAHAAALRGRTFELQDLIEARDAQIVDLNSALGANGDEGKEFAEQLKAATGQLETVTGDLKTAESKLKDTESQLQISTDRVAALQQENKLAEVKIVDLMTELATAPTGKTETGKTEMSRTEFMETCSSRVGDLLAIGRINFASNGAVIQDDSFPLLDQITRLVNECSGDDLMIEIGGHTDSRGSAEYNQQLSEARANAVRDYIVEKGAEETRLTAVGFGEEDPVANNGTPEGRAQNRRISFQWAIQN